MKILFIDLDGVLADWDKKINFLIPNLPSKGSELSERDDMIDPFESKPGFYRDIEPIEGAVEAFKELCKHYDVYILSTPSWHNPSSFTDKRLWVEEHLGDHVEKRLILSHRKDLCIGDYLIDDRIKNGVAEFKGEHIHFATEKFPDWNAVLKYLIPVRC